MSDDEKCPLCGGNLQIENGFLHQIVNSLPAIIKICLGGGNSRYGCGYKSWRRKIDLTT